MFSRPFIYRSAEAASKYFEDELSRDYYLGSGVKKGEADDIHSCWWGKGSERLGLSGHAVDRAAFDALCENRYPMDPDRQLTVRMEVDRKICTDQPFSACKEASVLALIGGDQRLIEAIKKANAAGIDILERHACVRVRAGKADADRRTGELVVAQFEHWFSRSDDPQLHVHNVWFNCTYDPVEKKWKALQNIEMLQVQKLATAVSRAYVADAYRQLGYEVQVVVAKTQLEPVIAGVPPAVLEIYSQRSAQIAEEIKRQEAARGRKLSQEECDRVVRQFRPKKTKGLSRDQSITLAKARISPEQLCQLEELREGALRRGPIRMEDRMSGTEALAWAKKKCFDRHSTVSVYALAAEAITYGLDRGIDPKEVFAAIEADPNLWRSTTGPECTTQEVVVQELELIEFVAAGRGRFKKGIAPDFVPEGGLSPEQVKAVRFALGSRDQVVEIEGAPGVGKSVASVQFQRAFEQVRSSVKVGAEESGGQIAFLAPTGTSRENLRKDGLDAITLQMFLVNEGIRPASGSVLVLDEAGLVSVPQMHALFTLAYANDYRIVLVGDAKQHGAVERGDALRLLESERDKDGKLIMARASILQIRRQRDPKLLAAIQAFRDGRLTDGFDQIDTAGWVEEISAFEEVTQAAADHYVALQVANSALPRHKRKTILACAPTHRENDIFNRKVREGLIKSGLLQDPETVVEVYQAVSSFAEQDRRSPVHVSALAPGMVIQVDRDIRALGLKKGDAVRLTGFERAGTSAFLLAERNGENMGLAVGELTKAFKSWTPAKYQSIKLRPGDRLLLRANGHGLRHGKKCPLVNGEIVEVSAFSEKGVELADGRIIPRGFRNFRYAYGVTSHAGQSQTVDHSIMLVTDQGMPTANSKQFLVSSSRGKESLRIFTTSASELRDACQQAGDRALATDLVRNGARRQAVAPDKFKHLAAAGHTPGIFEHCVPAFRSMGNSERLPITGVVIARLQNLLDHARSLLSGAAVTVPADPRIEDDIDDTPGAKKDDMPI